VTPPLALTAPHRVLLLVSCQRGALVGPHAMPCAPRLRHNLSTVLAAARGADPAPLIVHVRNAGAAGDVDEVGQPGWELWTDPREGELVLDKHKGSAWWGTGLADLVSPRAEVVVVGCASDYCIRDTCRDAAERKNTVRVGCVPWPVWLSDETERRLIGFEKKRSCSYTAHMAHTTELPSSVRAWRYPPMRSNAKSRTRSTRSA
jgi:nicotinamidase-related amidase